MGYSPGWVGRYIITGGNLTYTRIDLVTGDNEEENVLNPLPYATTVSVLVITRCGDERMRCAISPVITIMRHAAPDCESYFFLDIAPQL